MSEISKALGEDIAWWAKPAQCCDAVLKNPKSCLLIRVLCDRFWRLLSISIAVIDLGFLQLATLFSLGIDMH